ncbi:hypothetical protein KEM52_005250 [Ascosphaera acerosa]|nr:hypothetical protein KEM52_005250 [Ascosphaera acerosa]
MPQSASAKPFGSWRRKFRFEKDLLEARQSVADRTATPGPPLLSLADVETRLNMHQYSGLFDTDGNMPSAITSDSLSETLRVPSGTLDRPETSNSRSSSHEWNVVGHASTAKTGRVIHHLQEEIARLTRECKLQRLRAEEEQQTNDTLKLQLSHVTDRLNNAEQLHEADVLSITRKDRKIEELKAEIEKERAKRIKSEEDAKRTNQIAAEAKDLHTRTIAEAQETASQSKTQYEAIAKAHTRTLAETQMRISRFRQEVAEIGNREANRQKQLARLEAIIAQKDKELAAGEARMQQFIASLETYKSESENAVGQLAARAQRNDEEIERMMAEAAEVVQKMRWADNVRNTLKSQE